MLRQAADPLELFHRLSKSGISLGLFRAVGISWHAASLAGFSIPTLMTMGHKNFTALQIGTMWIGASPSMIVFILFFGLYRKRIWSGAWRSDHDRWIQR